jgi:hypothetical protein
VYTFKFYRYILWVPYYMHMLVQYFDYFLCDGSHGYSRYGWKFVPLVVLSSAGWAIPIGSVFGLEEDSESLNALFDLFRQHCTDHDVHCHHFNLRSKDAGISVHPNLYNLHKCTLLQVEPWSCPTTFKNGVGKT